jgi:hypothetical protein
MLRPGADPDTRGGNDARIRSDLGRRTLHRRRCRAGGGPGADPGKQVVLGQVVGRIDHLDPVRKVSVPIAIFAATARSNCHSPGRGLPRPGGAQPLAPRSDQGAGTAAVRGPQRGQAALAGRGVNRTPMGRRRRRSGPRPLSRLSQRPRLVCAITGHSVTARRTGQIRPSPAIQRRSGDGGFLSNSGLTRSWLALNERTYLATPTFECFCGAPTG